MKDKKNKITGLIAAAVSVVCLMVLWAAGSLADKDGLYPSVSETLTTAFTLWGDAVFYGALFSTLLRSFIAFLCSFILAFIVAYCEKKWIFARGFFRPIIAVIRALPTIAVVLLLAFWTDSYVAPVIVTSLVVFPMLVTNVKETLESVTDEQLIMCKAFNVKPRDVMVKVRLPQIAPGLLQAVGAGLSLNLKLMVAAEVLAHTAKSIGYYLNLASIYDKLPVMTALVLSVVIIGLLTEGLFNFLSARVSKWK